ncbi:MAG TPA: ATP-binding cassette domain-containing protein [bacterium]|nr:ATP-binding cassette domain-containing protein [bacterium]
MKNENELLKFENVSYSINGKDILTGINWTIKEKEHWAVLGPNGAGKSTLLKLIYGFVWPNKSGIIFRKTRQYIDLSELRKSIGWVSNELISRIPPGELVIDAVISGKYAQFGYWDKICSGNPEEDRAAAEKILSIFNVSNLKERTAETLSQGEFQKVLLSRALMSNPYLVILDEPAASLDPGAREIFLNALKNYITNFSTPSFIFITHHIDEIIDEFKHLLIIKKGRIEYCGDIEKGITSDAMSKLYDNNFKVIQGGKRRHLILDFKTNEELRFEI